MPLFSEHIANMYYGSSSPYTGLPYSYSSSSVSPLGSSYSASYLNPGGSYSNHSSLSSYSRAPLSSRWITSTGRNYSPMLSTITERGSSSPVRINSPRRIPISARTYGTPTYTPRPVNINTADIDVSRDRYKHKVEPPAPSKPESSQLKESANAESENGPFMPRVDGKPETGIDSSPGVQRSTIKRGRTVVRLYTIKRNSPRKPTEVSQTSDTTQDQEVKQNVNEDIKPDEKEFMKWREKLSDDLNYKAKKENKTLGAKHLEKFIVKNDNEKDNETPINLNKKEMECLQSLPETRPNINCTDNKSFDRRCSVELLAEQANLLDSLIRSENLSTATLDLSKVGITAVAKNSTESFESIKRRKSNNIHNTLKTTKSDHSLHDSLKDVRDPRNFSKRRSIRKSSSGSSIRRLDSITEFPKESTNTDLPAIEENRLSRKKENSEQRPKPKLKTKITTSVEVSAPMSPLKFRVENITVEEKLRKPKKEIIYSSEVVEMPFERLDNVVVESKEINNVNKNNNRSSLASPDPEDGNFWDKIGKRETVYLIKRKQNLDEAREKHKRALFWFPEEEEGDNNEEIIKDTNESKTDSDSKTSFIDKEIDIHKNKQKESIQSPDTNENINIHNIDELALLPEKEFPEQQKNEDILTILASRNNSKINSQNGCVDESVTKFSPVLNSEVTTETLNENYKPVKNNEADSEISSCKPNLISKECKNIGKSASLDENKARKSSQKKTKSEKSNKALKNNEKPELKSLQLVLPKINTKTKIAEKCDSSKISQITAVVKKELPIQSPKQQMAEINTSEKNQTLIDAENDLFANQLPISVVEETNNTILKTNTNNLLQTDNSATDALANSAITTSTKTTEQKVMNNLIESKAVLQKSSLNNKTIDNESMNNTNEQSKLEIADRKTMDSFTPLFKNEGPSTSKVVYTPSNNAALKLSDTKVPILNKNNKVLEKASPNAKPKPSTPSKNSHDVTINDKTDDVNNLILKANNPSTSSDETMNICSQPLNIPVVGSEPTMQQTTDFDSKLNDLSLHEETKTIDVPDIPTAVESQDIPNKQIETKTELRLQNEHKTGEENKAENIMNQKNVLPVQSTPQVAINLLPTLSPNRPVKEEKAIRPLIATPRPLQKKTPQVIHSSDSSEEESSDDDDEDESDASEDSTEFYECGNNPDGRISTGSNDSGFDSSAPTSPATFSEIKKDCDVNCHRKCEKLTANLCGVNQRLLVEALASRSASKKGGEASGTSSNAAPAQSNNTDILEQELEQSTAYGIFRKTGRFTPPARSIPRFRKYTVEDFHFIKVLGKGSFGKVLLAELRDTEYYYAVKCLKKDVVLEDDDVECTLIERKVLALGTNHPYLCHLFATFQTDSHLFFVMEYLNGGDLMFHIQQSGRFPEARARFYAAEIASGLKFLHKRGIVYRDLKLDNILLDFEGHVRIADFGMCKLQIYLDKTADTFCGTPDYMAPEIIKGLKYNQTVDWWSFGVLLYEMLIGQSPFSGCDEDELFWSICNEMPSYPRFLSSEALSILTRLLDKDARTRLGGTECMHGDIRDQDFFHQIHWDRLERRELEAPFRPRVRHPMDTQYFDRAFTGERPRLTAVEPHVLRSMDQEPFRGFSYTNPNTTDR